MSIEEFDYAVRPNRLSVWRVRLAPLQELFHLTNPWRAVCCSPSKPRTVRTNGRARNLEVGWRRIGHKTIGKEEWRGLYCLQADQRSVHTSGRTEIHPAGS